MPCVTPDALFMARRDGGLPCMQVLPSAALSYAAFEASKSLLRVKE